MRLRRIADLVARRAARTPSTSKFMSESFDDEIAKAAARNCELAAHHRELAAKQEAIERRVAYYQHLVQQNKRLEREIAAMEGRPYYDEDDPNAAYPGDIGEPPDA
jgi:uncharacterized protein (DUF3084 family)